MTRGALVSTVMSKILTVSATVAGAKGSGTLTLISADVERVVLGFCMYYHSRSKGLVQRSIYLQHTIASFNDIWAAPLEVGIALWLLQRELGFAFFAPCLIALSEYYCHFRSYIASLTL